MKGVLVAVLVLVVWKESFARPKHDLEKPTKGLNNAGDSSGIRTILVRALEQMSDEELLSTLEASIDLQIRLCLKSLPLPGNQHSTSAPPPTERPASTPKFSTESAVINPTNENQHSTSALPPTEHPASTSNPTNESSRDAPRKESQVTIKNIVDRDDPIASLEDVSDRMNAVVKLKDGPHSSTALTARAEAVVEWDNELDRLARDEAEAAMSETTNAEKDLINDENKFSNDDSDSKSEKSGEMSHDEGKLNSDAGEFESIMTIGAQATEDQELPREEKANNWVGIELFKKPKVKDKKA